jgi:hypothetical protein
VPALSFPSCRPPSPHVWLVHVHGKAGFDISGTLVAELNDFSDFTVALGLPLALYGPGGGSPEFKDATLSLNSGRIDLDITAEACVLTGCTGNINYKIVPSIPLNPIYHVSYDHVSNSGVCVDPHYHWTTAGNPVKVSPFIDTRTGNVLPSDDRAHAIVITPGFIDANGNQVLGADAAVLIDALLMPKPLKGGFSLPDGNGVCHDS